MHESLFDTFVRLKALYIKRYTTQLMQYIIYPSFSSTSTHTQNQ